MQKIRKIIHIDMDAFFAAIEQRDFPEYRGKPLVVGGQPNSRGVVATASYEARKYGIGSAMPSSQARRLCPHAIFVYPRFDVYSKVSAQIMTIFREFTDLVESASLDEAYMDVTYNKKGLHYAKDVATQIKKQIFKETALTASAGVAPNKFLAKIASDMNKPDGLTVIHPDRVQHFLKELTIRKVPGIGKQTEAKMHRMKIVKLTDLQNQTEEKLKATFGKAGKWFYKISRGIDNRKVEPHRIRKSVSCEDTFSTDLSDLEEMKWEISKLAERVSKFLKKRNFRGRTITLKITFADFRKITRSSTLDDYVNDKSTLVTVAFSLLKKTEALERPVRLLGVGVSNLEHVDKMKEEKVPQNGQLTFDFE